MWDSRFGPHCLDCDKAGNVYFAYAGAMFSQTVQGLHLVKITPTGKQRFDTVLTSMPPYSTNPDLGTMPFNVQGAYVSAPVSGL